MIRRGISALFGKLDNARDFIERGSHGPQRWVILFLLVIFGQSFVSIPDIAASPDLSKSIEFFVVLAISILYSLAVNLFLLPLLAASLLSRFVKELQIYWREKHPWWARNISQQSKIKPLPSRGCDMMSHPCFYNSVRGFLYAVKEEQWTSWFFSCVFPWLRICFWCEH